MPLFSSFTSTAARALGLTNGAPPGPPVISNVTVSSVSISFNITAVLGSFTIQRFELRVNNGAWTNIGNVSSHTITGLTSSTTYTFDVRAIDIANQTSDPSILQTVTTNTEVLPGQPASVTLTQKSTTSDGTNALKLDLVFTAATQGTLPISSYQYRITKTSDSSVVIDWATTPVGAGTTFVISGLTPSTGYTASVRAVSSSGAQGTARTATATTAAVKLNSAPTVTYVTETQNAGKTAASITFNYGVSSGGTYSVTGYRWQLHTAAETSATVSPGVNVVTPEYSSGTTVTISVRSVDSQGNFSAYGSITHTVSVPLPGAPGISFDGPAFQTSIVSMKVNWGSSTNATKYILNGYNSSGVNIGSVERTSSQALNGTISNLEPGGYYYFNVTPYNGTAAGTTSASVAVIMGSRDVPFVDEVGNTEDNFWLHAGANRGGCSAGNFYGGSPGYNITNSNAPLYTKITKVSWRLSYVGSDVISPDSANRNCTLTGAGLNLSITENFGYVDQANAIYYERTNFSVVAGTSSIGLYTTQGAQAGWTTWSASTGCGLNSTSTMRAGVLRFSGTRNGSNQTTSPP